MPSLKKRVGQLEGHDHCSELGPLRLLLQFGGISEADAFARHEAEYGPIGECEYMVVRGVTPGSGTAYCP